MSETEPKTRLTAAERAARRRARVTNGEKDRISTILGDRIAPGDDFAAPPKEETKPETSNDQNGGQNENRPNPADMLGPGGFPDVSQMMEQIMTGGAGNPNVVVESPTSRRLNQVSDFVVALLFTGLNRRSTKRRCHFWGSNHIRFPFVI